MSRDAELELSFEAGAAWHVAWTSPSQEKRVRKALEEAGYTTVLPLVEIKGKPAKVVSADPAAPPPRRPVVAGYVFVRCSPWVVSRILDIEGVAGIVAHGKIIDRSSETRREYALARIPEAHIRRVIACSDDHEQIVRWLEKMGKISRKSTRRLRREAAQRKHIAKLAA